MSWEDAAQLETRLKLSLNSFDWPEVDAICAEIIGRIKRDSEVVPQSTAKTGADQLRWDQPGRNLFTVSVAVGV